MCTLSWSFHPSGYSVFFNRDERNTRAPALPPRQKRIDGVRVIAPQDADKGGSWIAVNEYGVLTCLLNLYEFPIPEPDEPFLSRGHLVMALAPCRDWLSSRSFLEGKDLFRYPPFQLVQFSTDGEVNCLKWSGKETEIMPLSEDQRPISGSSFRNSEVVARRTATFLRYTQTKGSAEESLLQLERFHLSHDPDEGAYSVNMHRDDARTVSISRIDVESRSIRFQYRHRESRCFEFAAPTAITMDR